MARTNDSTAIGIDVGFGDQTESLWNMRTIIEGDGRPLPPGPPIAPIPSSERKLR